MKEVVVTGYGLVSSLGHNPKEFEERMFKGDSGVVSIRGKIVGDNFPVPYGAVIDRQDLPESIFFKGQDTQSVLKSWLMTAVAAEQVLKDIPTKTSIDAIVYGTADGVSFEVATDYLKNSKEKIFDFNQTRSESSIEILRQVISKQGFNFIEDRNCIGVNSACASGNQAIGLAYQGIRSGKWKRCLVGGVDARCEPSNFMNFHMLGALIVEDVEPATASRPFSLNRKGFVRGEGAALLMLESREATQERKAGILGQVSGYGCTSDAYRLTDGREDGLAVIEAMRLALQTAGLQKEQIGYINAHGTSTPLNDRLETRAIKSFFGEQAYKIPVSSLKSQIGHSTIAASALEAVACLLMLQRQKIAPTINSHFPDPECDLDYVPNVSRPARLDHVLSNSFGFGGQNTCVVFSREPS